jgi:hypothetical protein
MWQNFPPKSHFTWEKHVYKIFKNLRDKTPKLPKFAAKQFTQGKRL